jgi:hypothetical protein
MRLADTSIRLYRKRDGSVSVKLHSYLMIHCKGHGFRLSAYLNKFDCTLTLASGEVVLLDEYSYTDDCLYRMDHMIHEFWASGVVSLETIKDTAGLLHIEYRLFSFEGHGAPSIIEQVVPVLARGVHAKRWAWKTTNAAQPLA